jgi:hypothetical protein
VGNRLCILSKLHAVECPTHHISARGGHRGSVLSQVINGTAEPDQLVQRGESSVSTCATPSKLEDLVSVTDNGESSVSTCGTPLGSIDRPFIVLTETKFITIALVHAQDVVGHRGRRREPHQRTEQTGTCMHAPPVHVKMHDNDSGVMTLRALGRQFSG